MIVPPAAPTNLANPIAPLNPIGQRPVGQEDASLKITTTKPVEQLATLSRSQLRLAEKFLDDDSRIATSSFTPQFSPSALSDDPQFSGFEESEGGQNSDPQENLRRQQEAESRAEARVEDAQERQEQLQINELSARDREVRAHEQAHVAVGGRYAGAATYQYERGPNGVNYAVGGEVSIDTGRAGTPEETIQKAQVIRRAALAPADPSPQDRNVAAQASRLEAEARRELAIQNAEEAEARKAEDGGETESPNGLSSNNLEDGAVNTTNASSSGAETASLATSTTSFSNPTSVSSRLQESIASTSLSSPRPGALLDQIV